MDSNRLKDVADSPQAEFGDLGFVYIEAVSRVPQDIAAY